MELTLSADEAREVSLPTPIDPVSFVLDDPAPLRLTFEHLSEATVSDASKLMDPYRASPAIPGARGELIFRKREHPLPRLIEVQRPAGDGLITSFDGSNYHLLEGNSALTLPTDPIEGDTYEVDQAFNIRRAWRRVVLPALQMAVSRAGGVAVHSSSVQIGGRGILIAGWSESGKTETALSLAEAGGLFLSDKWTILHEGSMYVFPISAGIRSWVLEYLPAFRNRLTTSTRIRLGVSGLLSRSVSGTNKAVAGTRLAPWASRFTPVVGLADRASLSPSNLSRALGRPHQSWSSHLDAFVVLTTVPGDQIQAEPCEPSWAAKKMARSAAYERRAFFDLFERASFASPRFSALPAGRVLEIEESRLKDVLGNVQTLQIRAPFPVDPRKVADAIQDCL